MQGYIPRPDSEFKIWLANFNHYAQANGTALGLTPAELAELGNLVAQWEEVFADHWAAHAAARAARQAKDTARRSTEVTMRALARRLQSSSAVGDDERKALGITVADRKRTRIAPVTTRPKAVIDVSQPGRHIIRFFDAESPTRRARPRGAIGCEIWAKAGDGAVTDFEADFRYLGLQPTSPYCAKYEGRAGQRMHYILRWVNNHGEKGPWSDTASALIGG